MSHRPSEEQKIFNEIVTISSAAGANSRRYSMSDCYKITFCVGMGTAAASTTIRPTVTARQAVDEAAATSTTIAGATAQLGASTANQINNAAAGLITFTTASTLTETVAITVGGSTYTLTEVGQSTLVSTVATALAFGSSVGSTNAGGLDALANSLSSVINASTLSKWITAATASTASVRITVNDTGGSTGFNALTTGTNIAPSYEKSMAIIEVLAEDLNATSQYAYVALSSAATAVQMGITVIKSGMRQQPPAQVGPVTLST